MFLVYYLGARIIVNTGARTELDHRTAVFLITYGVQDSDICDDALHGIHHDHHGI